MTAVRDRGEIAIRRARRACAPFPAAQKRARGKFFRQSACARNGTRDEAATPATSLRAIPQS